MLLTISTTHEPASDLGFLLHKHPERYQSFELSFGLAHVFYPHVSAERCEACLLLDVDPVRLVRGKGDWKGGMLDQYVNDRPFVASSLMSVAISQVFGSALAGRSKERAELVGAKIPLSVRIDVLPVRGGEGMVVKPLKFVSRGGKGLVQPAVKCRGKEYLRIIYGPDYDAPEHFPRLRNRGLGGKRSLALREFALGLEGLERFVRREPLRRTHECVFGVLALESEPVDPRL